MSKDRSQPPKWPMRFFRFFCHSELRDFVEGDLIELYRERVETLGLVRARRRFYLDVLLLLRPDIIGFTKVNHSNHYTMFKNHLKIGARNLWKDRFYTSINLLGLAMGLAFSFLVLLLVKHEFSYDRFYEEHETVYRLGVEYNINGKVDAYSNAPRPFGPTFQQDYPEVEAYTRMRGVNGLTEHRAHLKYNEEFFFTDQIFVADSSFFKVFDRKILRGDKDRFLTRPATLVLSESMAQKLFGEVNPIGKEVEIAETGKKLEVTGIFEDVPANSHNPYNALVSWNGYYNSRDNEQWFGRHVYTYVRLTQAGQDQKLLEQFPDFFNRYMKEGFDQVNGKASLIVQPVADIHLQSNLNWEAKENGDLTSVYVLLAIGIFLVVIAEVNYLNLSLARSSLRKKEISVRKVIGASRSNISGQFVVETLLFTVLAAGISLVLVRVFYSEFQSLSGVDVLPFSTENLLMFWAINLGLGLVVSIYPSMVLSGVRLVEGLKGRSKTSREGNRLQRLLVVLQFTVSTVVILFTLVVKNQLNYIFEKDLGFDKENVVVFDMQDSVLIKQSPLIKQRSRELGAVSSVSFASDRPGGNPNHLLAQVETEGEHPTIASQYMVVDNDFVNTLGLDILEGRNFIKGSEQDASGSMLINEAAMKKFGWDDPLGKKIYFVNNGRDTVRISAVGVFKDFNMGSLRTGIDPLLLFYTEVMGNQLMVRLEGGEDQFTLNAIEEIMAGFNPRIPPKYDYLDLQLDRQYADEKVLSSAMTYLSGLIILISVMGFIGLLSFSIAQREKEIGIRKVLGAKVSTVTALFYRDILWLMIIAQAIAIPINYYLSRAWLGSFEYRTFPGLLEFGLVVVAILVVSIGTMSFQVVRVAFMNPVKVIKDE